MTKIGNEQCSEWFVTFQVVLVVAQNLGMSPGKLGAQCAHAAVGLYKLMVRQRVPWLPAWEVRTLD